jgi:tetratricopeptide (TPR) repeat protein
MAPEPPLSLGYTLHDLGGLYVAMGSTSKGRMLLEEGMAISAKILGADHPEMAYDYSTLGYVLHELGDYRDARPYLERALKLRENSLAPDHPDLAVSIASLARLMRVTGDDVEATQLYERAFNIAENFPPNSYADTTADIEMSLGLLYIKSGDADAGIRFLRQAYVTTEQAFDDNHSDIAQILHHIAAAERNMGNYSDALDLHRRAIQIAVDTLGAGHPNVAYAQAGLAETLATTGDWEAAMKAALAALRISLTTQQITTRSLVERQALAFSATRRFSLDLALSILASQPKNSPASQQLIWDEIIRSRALVLDEMATRRWLVSNDEDQEVARLAAELAATRKHLASLFIQGPESDTEKRYEAEFETAGKNKERAERALAQYSEDFRESHAMRSIGYAQVASAISADDVLVSFVQYDQQRFDQHTEADKRPEPVPLYVAFILHGGEAQPTMLSLASVSEIENLVTELRKQISLVALDAIRAVKENETAFRAVGEELREKLWDPLLPFIAGAQKVFIVPDGAISLISFASLPIDGGRYLIDAGPMLHYVSAERDLAPPLTTVPGEGLLAIGDPAFNASSTSTLAMTTDAAQTQTQSLSSGSAAVFRGQRSACGRFQTLRFRELPATAREAEGIANIWQSGDQSTGPVVHLSGQFANEAAIKRQAIGKRVVHFATHGFFLDDRCTSTLESGEDAAWVGDLQSLTGENPLLLSGLALAGANNRQNARLDEEDGILTAEEIASVNLSGVEWAVLSACDTGLGTVKTGEGVLGLRRAFQIAGARTLIFSLWPVEDETAQQWMQNLYTNRFVEGLSTISSVHGASLAMLRERRAEGRSTHPFYWAGFVAAGDWR